MRVLERREIASGKERQVRFGLHVDDVLRVEERSELGQLYRCWERAPAAPDGVRYATVSRLYRRFYFRPISAEAVLKTSPDGRQDATAESYRSSPSRSLTCLRKGEMQVILAAWHARGRRFDPTRAYLSIFDIEPPGKPMKLKAFSREEPLCKPGRRLTIPLYPRGPRR